MFTSIRNMIELGEDNLALISLIGRPESLNEKPEEGEDLKRTAIMYARIDVLKYLLDNKVDLTKEDIEDAQIRVSNGPLPAIFMADKGDADRIDEAKDVLALLKKYQAKQKRTTSSTTTNNTTDITSAPILTQFNSQSSLQSLTLDPISEDSCYEADDDEKENNKVYGFKGG